MEQLLNIMVSSVMIVIIIMPIKMLCKGITVTKYYDYPHCEL